MKVGRPTDYSEEILKLAREYVDSCADEIGEILESENEKTGRNRFTQKLVVKLPKVEGLCLYLGIARSTAYEWAKIHEEFSDILEEINQIQADRVINEALAGNYNPMIAKLLLGKHGYKESSDVTSDGHAINYLLVKFLQDDKGNSNGDSA
jgi:hypothetical protein